MRTIDKIVIHHAAVTYDLDPIKTLASFEKTHKERLGSLGQPVSDLPYGNVAYHYVIAKYGNITACRAIKDIGYHASNWEVNKESIGICLMGDFDKETPTNVQYGQLRYLINTIKKEYNVTVHLHKEYDKKKTCPGKHFDINQLSKSVMTQQDKEHVHNKTGTAIGELLGSYHTTTATAEQKNRIAEIKGELLAMRYAN